MLQCIVNIKQVTITKTSNPIVHEQWIGLSISHASCRIWKVHFINSVHFNLDTAARKLDWNIQQVFHDRQYIIYDLLV
jgi:hypothetical protein